MPARFRIKRTKNLDPSIAYPWKVKDAMRPAFLGQYPTHARAIAAIDERLATETGIPTRRSIREAMSA